MEVGGRKVELMLCMNGGDGEGSYARNSNFQRRMMSKAMHIVEESVVEVYNAFLPECLVVADLGCATGPNALLAVSEIIGIVGKVCNDMGRQNPSCLVYLNDLPSNDFNAVFKSLPEFNARFEKEDRECYVAAVSGSFYDRLFPSKALHFVHSSYTLHWLSQVPRGLISETGEALNKGNICIAETSSMAVQEAYCVQFNKDFTAFLKSRSAELMLGGSMVLTMPGSSRSNAPFKLLETIGLTLLEMAKQGLIQEADLDMFNMPIHAASADQINETIQNEGSFDIRKLEVLKARWDTGIDERTTVSQNDRGEFIAKYLRAVLESLLAPVFGESVMDELFQRVAMKFTKLMECDADDCYYYSFVVWLKRKTKQSTDHQGGG